MLPLLRIIWILLLPSSRASFDKLSALLYVFVSVNAAKVCKLELMDTFFVVRTLCDTHKYVYKKRSSELLRVLTILRIVILCSSIR